MTIADRRAACTAMGTVLFHSFPRQEERRSHVKSMPQALRGRNRRDHRLVSSLLGRLGDRHSHERHHHDDDVNTSGVATSHPTSRRVSFGYKDAMGLHPEQTVTTSSQDVGGGMYNWECTLLAPTNPPENGWQLSPVQEGEVIPDHVIWVYSTSTQDIDDKSEDHKVIQ